MHLQANQIAIFITNFSTSYATLTNVSFRCNALYTPELITLVPVVYR